MVSKIKEGIIKVEGPWNSCWPINDKVLLLKLSGILKKSRITGGLRGQERSRKDDAAVGRVTTHPDRGLTTHGSADGPDVELPVRTGGVKGLRGLRWRGGGSPESK